MSLHHVEGWFEAVDSPHDGREPLNPAIDPGEASAIGTAALIGLARTQGLGPAAKPWLDRLAQSGDYLGKAGIDAVPAEAGG